VSEYEVSVRGGTVDWQVRVVNQVSVAYPEMGPTLNPGRSFIVVVNYKDPDSGKDRSSQEEGIAGLGFSVLSGADLARLTQYEQQVKQLSVTESAKEFVAVSILATMGLRNEAIDRIEKLASIRPVALAARVAGALYEEQSLHRAAERWYLKAAGLAKDAQDTEGQAIAAERLSEVYSMLGNPSEAKTQLARASELYQQLGGKVGQMPRQP
jgi:tetratricopeptide (TPR) repeat protein